jgi:hypothetical protein
MAILAPELTREDLLAAMRARRFFSSRDMNLVLSFTCNGAEMCSVIEPGTLDIVIEASDGDDEVFSKIELQNMTGPSAPKSATTPIDDDTVVITKAEYSFNKEELKVEATTSDGGEVTLTVVGYGDMTYQASTDTHQFNAKPVPDPGETITVTSNGGGEDTIILKQKR